MADELILTVRKNSGSGQKMITVPKWHSIQAGDYVLVKKVAADKL